MIMSIAAAALALHVGSSAPLASPPDIQAIQYGVPVKRPPCGHGWDISARDGMCYPNGYLPPQEQAARRYYRGGGYGHYPVPCGHGADIDTRDGQCYPTGTVPPQFQQGRQGYYGDYYEPRPRRRYY
ncbi:hypothetical protein JQ617_07030 [Bradyrhizobium sp. KB893862 SZCCT0404]|uniref:hypothetical protein n=1 Tax=Bradyrhizobium sp. KB893862 SZCCT0404 TaxID=2807672 RepID=UPI001BA57188|nr:hypothetical protein [Bradyrhizobium sp. KB893862 SZCCT0404]MBR1173704.1 hypothetical protein [Bradyrhizobium sp. KB893862 SZCCT0404]